MVFGFFKKKQTSEHGDVVDAKKVSMGSILALNMVAMADGKISPEEKQIIIEITSAYKGDLMSPREILETIEKTQSMLAEAGINAWYNLFDSLINPIDPIDQSFILHGAGTLALADGEVHEKELEMLTNIAQWMHMEEQDFINWAREFEQRMVNV